MQKPDAQGYVHITWPSKTIPYGGVFHSRVVEPTESQQQFLKVLLEESKLTIAQRQKSAFKLREELERPESQTVYQPSVRPRTSRRRSLSTIRESGIYELDHYKPLKRGEDREELKERLANTMAYGDSPNQVPPPAPRIEKPKPKLPTTKEKWNDLVTQIRERAEWLAEMEDLGHAASHRDIVKDQIAERMRALDALGIESECLSVRSGFSTLRSKEPASSVKTGSSVKSAGSVKSQGKAEKSVQSELLRASQEKKKATQSSVRSLRRTEKEESVTAYNQFSPLQYTPRRRV